MPVWRVSINSVKASRTEKPPQGMTVEVKPALKEAKTEKAGETELVRAKYSLKADYKPDVGSIEVAGDIYFVGLDKGDLKDGRIVNPEVLRQAYQRIFIEPMVVAISLAKELTLPLPVRMPEVKVEAAVQAARAKTKAKKKK
jgi:hypothetical protein